MASVLTSFTLTDRVALVTGGAGHLGRPMCRGLAEAGARVLINGRDHAKAEDFAARLRRDGHAAEALAFDVTDNERVAHCVGELQQLDILVNNAALGQTGTIATTSVSAFGPVAASVIEAAY